MDTRPDNAPPTAIPQTLSSLGQSSPFEDSGGTVPEFPTPSSPPRYEILSELGRGGMGVVYLARQTGLDRQVALKMILAGSHAGSESRGRFRAEAEAVARLSHPGIVQVHEVGEHDGLPFFSMEFCAGGGLDRRLKTGPLLPADTAALVETLARAMHHAHERGIVHRDLKPANVLLAACGLAEGAAKPQAAVPKITDFGLARKLDDAGRTREGAVIGTPNYMAPEQASGKAREVGPAADVWALGAILYECLTGRPPFLGATTVDTLALVMGAEPVSPRRLQPKVPRDLETICLKCLEKEPGRRYASASELADDLGRSLRGEPIRARPVGTGERVVKWARRKPAIASLLAGLAAVTLLGTAGVTWKYLESEEQRKLAEAERADAVDARSSALLAQGKADRRSTPWRSALTESSWRPAARVGTFGCGTWSGASRCVSSSPPAATCAAWPSTPPAGAWRLEAPFRA